MYISNRFVWYAANTIAVAVGTVAAHKVNWDKTGAILITTEISISYLLVMTINTAAKYQLTPDPKSGFVCKLLDVRERLMDAT